MNDYVTIPEAAKMLNMTRQNLYQHIWSGRLQSIKFNGNIYTRKIWLQDYMKKKGLRQYSKYNGKPIFDDDNFSTISVAKILDIRFSHVHYLIKAGLLRSTRKGYYHVISRDDLVKYMTCQKDGEDLYVA